MLLSFDDNIKQLIINSTENIINADDIYKAYRGGGIELILSMMYDDGSYITLDYCLSNNISASECKRSSPLKQPINAGGGKSYRIVFILLLSVTLQFMIMLFCVFSILGLGKFYVNSCKKVNISSLDKVINFFYQQSRAEPPGIVKLICNNSNLFDYHLQTAVSGALPYTIHLYGYMLSSILLQLKFGSGGCFSEFIKYITTILKAVIYRGNTSNNVPAAIHTLTAIEHIFKIIEFLNLASINSAVNISNFVFKPEAHTEEKLNTELNEAEKKAKEGEEEVKKAKDTNNLNGIKNALNDFLVNTGMVTHDILVDVAKQLANAEKSEATNEDIQNVVDSVTLSSKIGQRGGNNKHRVAKNITKNIKNKKIKKK